MSSSVSAGGSRIGSSRAVTFWGLVFAVLALGAVIAFYWGGQQRTQVEQLSLIADKQMELSASAGGLLARAAQGRPLAFEELSELQVDFSTHADSLIGEEDNPAIAAPSGELIEAVDVLEEEFSQFQSVVAEGVSLRGPVSSAGPAIRRLRENISMLSDRFEQLADKMKKALAPVVQVHAVSKEAILLRQVENSLLMLGQSGVPARGSAAELREYFDVFERTLNGLQVGDIELGVKRVGNASTRSSLEELAGVYRSLEGDVELLKSVSEDLDKASIFSSQLDHLNVSIKGGLESYQAAINKHYEQYSLIWKAGIGMGALALLALLLMVAQVQRDNRRQLQAIQEANQKSQNAILQLLDEMSTLAEGDLTVEATVSEEITGAIADSVNYAIEAMRQLVQTINLSSVRVENTAKQTQATTLELSESSKDQANQIERVSEAIEDLNRSIDKVSQNAEDSAEVADVSVSLSQKGVQTVRGTIDGMDVIRERIQDTSKRIKRLGESSQEIGDIVGLITDIADQTNILALNAAIQASAAGEGGRGFAVVADEVQRLAERSSNASKQIEALVKTIQADTNEAVQSMEQSTSHVVRGANLAEDSGRALEEIENVSHRLARLINDISSESREQAILSDKVTELMGAIQRITGQTVAGTNDTALAVGELVEQSRFLKQSVEGFKLSDELEELDVDILDIETEETEVEKPDDSLSQTS